MSEVRPPQDWPEIAAPDRQQALVPDGEYTARCVGCSRNKWGKGLKLVTLHAIVGGAHDGEVLPCYYNIERTPDGRLKAPGPSSRYAREWRIAAGDKEKRRDRTGARVFEGVLFLVRVETVKTDSCGNPLAAVNQYSKVAAVLEVIDERSAADMPIDDIIGQD